jgi:hypothetical protein
MKQTALEWLEEQMKTWGDLPRWMRDDIVEKAKEMEKQQIMDARMDGINAALKGYAISNEEYYNERFKKSE